MDEPQSDRQVLHYDMNLGYLLDSFEKKKIKRHKKFETGVPLAILKS